MGDARDRREGLDSTQMPFAVSRQVHRDGTFSQGSFSLVSIVFKPGMCPGASPPPHTCSVAELWVRGPASAGRNRCRPHTGRASLGVSAPKGIVGAQPQKGMQGLKWSPDGNSRPLGGRRRGRKRMKRKKLLNEATGDKVMGKSLIKRYYVCLVLE